MSHKIRIVKSKRQMIGERFARYDVLLNGEPFDELYYNLTGYVGSLPCPSDTAPGGIGRMLIGEKGLSTYRREAAQLNREFAS